MFMKYGSLKYKKNMHGNICFRSDLFDFNSFLNFRRVTHFGCACVKRKCPVVKAFKMYYLLLSKIHFFWEIWFNFGFFKDRSGDTICRYSLQNRFAGTTWNKRKHKSMFITVQDVSFLLLFSSCFSHSL